MHAKARRIVVAGVTLASLGGVGLTVLGGSGASYASRPADGGPGKGAPPSGAPGNGNAGKGSSDHGAPHGPDVATLVLTPETTASSAQPITIDVTSYDFSQSSTTSVSLPVVGAGAGTLTFSPLVVTTVPGAQTAGLFADLKAGAQFAKAELVVPGKPGGTTLLDATFAPVDLQKIEESSTTGPADATGQVGPTGPTETLSFGYAGVQIAAPASGSSSGSSSSSGS